jgi:hypothetical protein
MDKIGKLVDANKKKLWLKKVGNTHYIVLSRKTGFCIGSVVILTGKKGTYYATAIMESLNFKKHLVVEVKKVAKIQWRIQQLKDIKN